MPPRHALIVTADDFGLATEVNEAVELAHVHGIVTSASLMIGGPAASDAVARARHLPRLGVGLHLVLVDGTPVLPARRIPGLVGPDGRFREDLVRIGAAIFFRPDIQRQVAAEIEAQFAAFAATGLALDHVDSHRHFHLHPTVARLVVSIGRRFGMRTLRVPDEPWTLVRAIDPSTPTSPRFPPVVTLLRRRVEQAGLSTTGCVFGQAWSGAMTPGRVAALLRVLPAGLNELYAHVATADTFRDAAPGYHYVDELAALTIPGLRGQLQSSGIALVTASDVVDR